MSFEKEFKNKVRKDELTTMFSFLMMGKQKSNIPQLKEFCQDLISAMTQKTAGQSKYGKKIDWNEIDMIINGIVVETLALYLSGDLEKLCKNTRQTQKDSV